MFSHTCKKCADTHAGNALGMGRGGHARNAVCVCTNGCTQTRKCARTRVEEFEQRKREVLEELRGKEAAGASGTGVGGVVCWQVLANSVVVD